MNKDCKNKRQAFTIIEVIMVLAIAGLIFMVVFAAIPRLQASRRDSQRRDDGRNMYALVLEYQTNNGRLPNVSQLNTFLAPEGFGDPETGSYIIGNAAGSIGRVGYRSGHVCDGSGANGNDYTITMYLERGGAWCIDQETN